MPRRIVVSSIPSSSRIFIGRREIRYEYLDRRASTPSKTFAETDAPPRTDRASRTVTFLPAIAR